MSQCVVVSISFLLFLLVIAGVLLKVKKMTWGQFFLGVIIGLSLAGTAIGPPLLQGVTGLAQALAGGLSSVVPS